MIKKCGMENEFWKEDGGETAAGELHTAGRSWGHFITKACAFLVLISWSRQQLARVKVFRPRHPQPSLLGLWLEFLPGCPELPAHAASRLWLHPPVFPAILLVVSGRAQAQCPFPQSPAVATQSGLGILECQGPGTCHYKWQRLFSWVTAKQAPGNFLPATCRVAVKLSHRILPPRAKNCFLLLLFFKILHSCICWSLIWRIRRSQKTFNLGQCAKTAWNCGESWIQLLTKSFPPPLITVMVGMRLMRTRAGERPSIMKGKQDVE